MFFLEIFKTKAVNNGKKKPARQIKKKTNKTKRNSGVLKQTEWIWLLFMENMSRSEFIWRATRERFRFLKIYTTAHECRNLSWELHVRNLKSAHAKKNKVCARKQSPKTGSNIHNFFKIPASKRGFFFFFNKDVCADQRAKCVPTFTYP